jgi:hypothetical protein
MAEQGQILAQRKVEQVIHIKGWILSVYLFFAVLFLVT